MQFQPSSYSDYGAAEEDEGQSSSAMLEEYAPAISALLFGGDPRQQYEKKKATLATYKDLHAKAPSAVLKNIYAMKIRSLQAEIEALEEIVGEERTAVITTQAGKVGGAFMLVAGGVAALMLTNYLRQKSKTEKLQQRVLRQQVQ